jgi:ABC-type transport system involved in multi-copper enzyme maturation permease subunit
MKFLAILKDSFREAVDSKVFYAMIGLSLLLILLVGSVSFKPLSAEEALPSVVNSQGFRIVYRDRGRSLEAVPRFVAYEVRDIQKTNDAGEPQLGDYRFKLFVREVGKEPEFPKLVYEWSQEDRLSSEEKAPDVSDQMTAEFFKAQFSQSGNVEVESVKRVEPNTFEIQTKGGTAVRGWQHEPRLFFGALPLAFLRTSLGHSVYVVEDYLVNGIGAWVGILIGIVISAFFIPNMLRKGTVDLLIVKPIPRSLLLLYKYIGGLIFIFLNAVFAVGGMWLVLGMRTGLWSPHVLLIIFVLTFFFAVLYCISTLMSTLTGSPIVAILVTCVLWFGFWIVGKTYQAFEQFEKIPSMKKNLPDWSFTTVNAIHFITPRTADLDVLSTQLISRANLTDGEIKQSKLDIVESVSWGESLAVSGVFVVLMLGLSCWRFARKDY